MVHNLIDKVVVTNCQVFFEDPTNWRSFLCLVQLNEFENFNWSEWWLAVPYPDNSGPLFPEDFTCAIMDPIFQERNEEEGTETRIISVKLSWRGEDYFCKIIVKNVVDIQINHVLHELFLHHKTCFRSRQWWYSWIFSTMKHIFQNILYIQIDHFLHGLFLQIDHENWRLIITTIIMNYENQKLEQIDYIFSHYFL